MNIKDLLGRMKLSKEKQEKALIGFLLGVFFLLIAAPIGSLSGEKKQLDKKSDNSTNIDYAQTNTSNDKIVAYIDELENKLEQTIGGMEGVGKVSVMITLKDNGEKILDKNGTYESETEHETEDGMTKEKNRMQNSPETVLVEAGGDTSPIIVKEKYPMIEGVVVVCDGGDNLDVAMHIKEALQALFTIDAHKIVVCKSQTNRESED